MSKTEQPYLPLFAPERPTGERRERTGSKRWYFVVNWRRDEMLALDDKGNFVWIPNDTIRLTPHLFSTRRLAQLQARHYKYASVSHYRWRV